MAWKVYRGKLLVVIIIVAADIFALWFAYDRFGWQLPFPSWHKITETLSAFKPTIANMSDAINTMIRLMHEKIAKLLEFLNKARH